MVFPMHCKERLKGLNPLFCTLIVYNVVYGGMMYSPHKSRNGPFSLRGRLDYRCFTRLSDLYTGSVTVLIVKNTHIGHTNAPHTQ